MWYLTAYLSVSCLRMPMWFQFNMTSKFERSNIYGAPGAVSISGVVDVQFVVRRLKVKKSRKPLSSPHASHIKLKRTVLKLLDFGGRESGVWERCSFTRSSPCTLFNFSAAVRLHQGQNLFLALIQPHEHRPGFNNSVCTCPRSNLLLSAERGLKNH